ncbi:MAG: type I-C CRISPR-associated protein Cas8c/Csd1 [Paenibacillaceae bacterium]
MTWLSNLYKTYENNVDSIGVFEKKRNDQEFALIPVSHTTQSAQIEVSLDDRGNFVSAKVVDKSDSSTIIPCTEASASRTSAPVPHPLFDKLVYVAGDYVAYGGEMKKGNPHADYMNELRKWCDSPYAHSKVKSVYNYLIKGTLIEDLIKEKIMFVDEHNKLIEKWNKDLEEKYGEKPELFKVIASDQSGAFVRFAVNVIGEVESRLWRDKTVQESFIKFYNGKLSDFDLCFVSGESLPYADKHASRIRHSADMSKLISANDTSGFTFRGRFGSSRDAASISYEVSQKAHNALKWLIAKQGYNIDGKVFLTWGTQEKELPDIHSDSYSLYGEEAAISGDLTHKEYANQIKLALASYKHDLDYQSNVIIMILDAATPGRMSIVYYRDMNKELFIDRLLEWHKSCYWLHRYKYHADNSYHQFMGAPATKDIAFAAYGPRASDKIVKGLFERMLPSIIDGRPIPLDIVRSATNRASNPVSMELWEWERTLSVSCALLRKTYAKEDFDVALDTTITDRNYLFGRMLAIADVLERRALGNEEKRATNAIRYMNAFAQRPSRTWTIIQSNLQPYQAKLGTKVGYYNRLLDEVGAQLNPAEFTDKPLSGLYLLGFYSQRQELYTKKVKEAEEVEENIE